MTLSIVECFWQVTRGQEANNGEIFSKTGQGDARLGLSNMVSLTLQDHLENGSQSQKR